GQYQHRKRELLRARRRGQYRPCRAGQQGDRSGAAEHRVLGAPVLGQPGGLARGGRLLGVGAAVDELAVVGGGGGGALDLILQRGEVAAVGGRERVGEFGHPVVLVGARAAEETGDRGEQAVCRDVAELPGGGLAEQCGDRAARIGPQRALQADAALREQIG